MPAFISDEELRRGDVGVVAARAEEHISGLLLQIETHKARADAAVINAEQTCSLHEQKYVALLAQVSQIEGEKSQLELSLETKSSELAQAQAHAHQLELQLMKRDGSLESQSLEIKELHKARKEMLDVIEKKNLELDEKNAASRSYLERILALTEERSNLESRIHEQTAEVTRLRALEARLSQEKEITSQHNNWLNQELQTKVSNFLEERQRNAQVEANLQARVFEIEQASKEKEEALTRSQDRVKELETEVHGMIEELRFVKEDAAAKEEHLSTEVATASKLADLYKKSSEEWSRKVNDLEGVIKALEVHLNQSTLEFEEKVRKEQETRETIEKELTETKENYEKKIAELQQPKGLEAEFLQLENLPLNARDSSPGSGNQENAIALPSFPYGVSGTALAAALLRDGWSLGTVYNKYQEAVDAWRHEMHERNRAQALLEKVLREVESKAMKIMEERAEYARMLDAYVIMEEKVTHSVSDQTQLENSVRDLQAELRKKDRELKGALKDVSDLQTQVSVLVKECMDIQKRHGIGGDSTGEVVDASPVPDVSSADAIISDKLLTFKDIHGMVEHNTQLRALVRVLAEENERKEKEMKEEFESRLKLRIEEATEKVNLVLQRAEEQNAIIERLQGTVGMYKRLYEDERGRSTSAVIAGTPSDVPEREAKRLWDISQDELRRQLSHASDQIRSLEEQLSQSRHEISAARAASARAEAEAAFAKEKLTSLTRESENQRKQLELIISKNVEASQTITDYHRRLRESSQNVQNAEEQTRRLSIEVSVLEREKELLSNAEQRAAAEASQLSDRVHRLQATLDTIETAAEVREVSRGEERRKLEEEVNRMQKEWVEAKHQLELERSFVRSITSERDKALERIESLNQELKGALAALSASELRTKIAEARCGELEANVKRTDEKFMALAGGKKVLAPEDSDKEVLSTLEQSHKEIELLREELQASKVHVEQYKHIAKANEEALKKMEENHSKFREEAAKTKDVMDSELKLLQTHLSDVESLSLEKERETGTFEANREALLREALKEVASLKDAEASKQAALQQAETRVNDLKEELDKVQSKYRQAQTNYERQVMLQAETLQELTLVNERVARLEQEENKLRGKAEKAEAELESVNVAFFMEKSALEAAKADLEKRLKDLDSQNCLLLDRLEAKHISSAEQERKASSSSSGEDGLQNVIHYLRRAKEAAETEMSLLRQEKNRLTKQYEAATRSAEEAQEKLRHHHESMRASLYTDEEFQALQTQVMELNLLREKNVEFRDENKRLSEENKELRERLSKLEEEHEAMKRSLRDKQSVLEANAGEIETLKAEVRRWQQRVSQMFEKYKSLDVDDYEKTKSKYAAAEERLKQLEKELEIFKRDAAESRESITKHEQEALTKSEALAQAEKRVQEVLSAEASVRTEFERARKAVQQLKRKMEMLNKEKESMAKELEELKGKSSVSEAAHHEAVEREVAARLDERSEQIQKFEQSQREAEQRMKSLEKMLEKEREEKTKEKDERTKEKMKRDKDRQAATDFVQKARTEINALRQEIEQYQKVYGKLPNDSAKPEPEEGNKAAVDQAPEAPGDLPSTSGGAKEQAPTSAMETSAPAPTPAPAATPAPTPAPSPSPAPAPAPSSSPAPAPAADAKPLLPGSKLPPERERAMQELRIAIIEREKVQPRRPGRRFVRPKIGEASEPAGEMLVEGTPEVEGDQPLKASSSEVVVLEAENTTTTTTIAAAATHKRSSSETLENDQAAINQEAKFHPQKKARGNEAPVTQETGAPEMSEESEEQKVAELPVDEQDPEAGNLKEKSPEPPGTSGAAESMAEDVIPVEDPGAILEQQVEGDVVEADEMQTDQVEGAITDTDELPEVEDGEIGAGEEELDEKAEVDGEEQKQEQEALVVVAEVASPALEAHPDSETPDAPAAAAAGSVDGQKTPGDRAPADASSGLASGSAAAAPSSTTINLSDRARERGAMRRQKFLSPQSPKTRARGRGNPKGRGGGRA